MSRIDCISNRNIKIIAAYVRYKLGHHDSLFDGLPYPSDRYAMPDDFFLHEDEWTTLQNFQNIFRKAKEMVGEPYFCFNCGASSARLRSWGRLDYFMKVFSSASDGFIRLPFFNRNLNDTKDIEVVIPPSYDRVRGKVKTVIKIQYHDDIDVHKDYLTDSYRRGMIASIPTLWGLQPARVRQRMNPYDPVLLFKEEPEFASLGLDVRMEKNHDLTLIHPQDAQRKTVGRKVLLEPEPLNGKSICLGKYIEPHEMGSKHVKDKMEAILMTETIRVNDRIIFKAGEIFRAPYFILDVDYDRLSLISRLSRIFKNLKKPEESGKDLIETINRLRENIEERNQAYHDLEKTNEKLKAAKKSLLEYTGSLEEKVEERTSELRKAKEELLTFNRGLQAKVEEQVEALTRFNELRRYLSPKLTEKILSSGDTLGALPQRKMMTVLFSDIRGFSALTDGLEPEEIFTLLDRYLSEMIMLIHQYEGTLNKIIGDGLLIFFGDPVPMDDHAERAVKMAIDMQNKVTELKEEWLHYGHELKIGIGINTGYMTVGNIGSETHRDYTVIGNQVNVAARLESLAEPGQILISQRTYSRVKNLVEVEGCRQIQVKGIHTPIMTYNVKVPQRLVNGEYVNGER